VQRYGLEINGGAEYHARLIAEKLAKHVDIEVFTSTALDYISWEHHYSKKKESINQIPVHRFKVKKQRDPKKFGEIQNLIFFSEHSLNDEIRWLEEEGPFVPDLLEELERRESEFDYFIFFSYRYYHSYHGLMKFPHKSILVPTAEHDEVLYLRLFKELFLKPAAIIYNSAEEKANINKISDNHDVLSDVVGVGSEIPENLSPGEFRKNFKIEDDFFLYIGRIDENKGFPMLFNYFIRFLEEESKDVNLVLIGKAWIDITAHPNIKHLGFLSDQDKFNALKASKCLIIPSQFESLSMVTLEAWALSKPVIANGNTDVLKGQCKRSNAGLWFKNYEEFKEVILLLLSKQKMFEEMGKNGREFFNKHYSWDVIEKKYLNILQKLEKRKGGKL
jgi:glycosyltransferase involved in cell wall biosynthesis